MVTPFILQIRGFDGGRDLMPRMVTLLVAAVCVAGCASLEATGEAQSSSVSESTTPNPEKDATATPIVGVEPAVADVTLAFGGDVHFERHVRDLLNEPRTASELPSQLRDADFAMVNLETAIAEGGAPIPGKPFTFRAPLAALAWLAGGGVDAVSIANNHGADYGSAGLAETLTAKASSPVRMVGVGENSAEAYAPLTVEVGGMQVAVLASSQLTDETTLMFAADEDGPGIAANHRTNDELVAVVKEAAAEHDATVVFLHWGTQYTTCPSGLQKATAQELSDAGADIVVGAHAHRPQGSGWLNDSTYVGYGLGNFVWWKTAEPDTQTGVLEVTLDGEAVAARAAGEPHGPVVANAQWTPMLIGADGIPREQDAETTARLIGVYEEAQACSGLS